MNGALIEVKPRLPFTNLFLSLFFLLLQRHQPKEPAAIYQTQPHRPEVRFSQRPSPYDPKGNQIETMMKNYDNLEDEQAS
ncbi:uncharacterized protein CLUP02_06685 [Colletotrichum lupini]|uniref:Uncharacterized protein n=1 Tax=Colletotrichum lupini TaxID=145971 RepID=A0A9Q8SPK2_9PEZI|nr:uncharacterized protein CLUP02_06685 [Colletotrichum lupini]UQC81199.1 hypothetical protein CLUP02_06685 [Colletotrichum lupini]